MTIYGREITQKDMENIGSYMVDDVREDLHSKLAPCKPEEFLKAYLEVEPDFEMLLEDEFDFQR